MGQKTESLTFAEEGQFWAWWKRGQSLNGIARVLAKHRGSIHSALGSLGDNGPGTDVLTQEARERTWESAAASAA